MTGVPGDPTGRYSVRWKSASPTVMRVRIDLRVDHPPRVAPGSRRARACRRGSASFRSWVPSSRASQRTLTYFLSETSAPPTDQLSCGIGSNTTQM